MSRAFSVAVLLAVLLYTIARGAILLHYAIPKKPTIIIASSFPVGWVPKDIAPSAKLAFDKYSKQAINANLVLDIRDDVNSSNSGSDETRLKRNIAEFSEDPRVVAFYGPIHSVAAKLALPALNRAGMPTLSPTCSLPSLTKPGFAISEPGRYQPTLHRNFARLITTDDSDSHNAAQWIKELGAEKVAVVDDQSLDYSSTLLYINYLTGVGVDVTNHHALTASGTASIVQQIVNENPDLVYYQGFSDELFINFIRELRKHRFNGALMGADSVVANVDITKIANEVEGMYVTSSMIPLEKITDPRAKAFSESYKRAYGENPTSWGALAYDGMRILIDAIAKSDGTRASINSILLSTKDFPTIFGNATFDAYGDNKGGMLGRSIIRSGRMDFLQFVPQSELVH